MSLPLRDAGSYRDPGGSVYLADHHALRTVNPAAAQRYRAARDAGLFRLLSERGLCLPVEEVSPERLGPQAAGCAHVLASPRLPFVSYPYEWCFALHRRAALLHLDVQLAALERGFHLSDASAYNVQFQGVAPVFIDHLSVVPYEDGEVWHGHRQFCMQFLNPLLMHSRLGIPPNAWFRGGLEGIEPERLAPLLPWRSRLSLTEFTHVILHARLERRATPQGAGRRGPARLSKRSLVAMLEGLRRFVSGLRPPGAGTLWSDYAETNGYSRADAEAKRRFVGEMTAAVRPRQLWDLGCNTGEHADVALRAGAGRVVGWDFDHGALDRAVARAERDRLDFLPLWMDAANPSPAQGWASRERRSLQERASADAVLALAFVHHLAIGRNVPLDSVVAWLVGLAPAGVIEFPPKDDPMVRSLLAQRADIFPDYTEEAFLAHVRARARIVRTGRLPDGGRLLVWYERG